MRAYILEFIVFSLSFIALFRPKIGIAGYLWFSLMRPDVMAYTWAPFYSGLLALFTMAGSVRYIGNLGRLTRNPVVICFLVFLCFLGASVVAAVDQNLAVSPYTSFLRLAIMALILVMLTETQQDAKLYFIVFAGSAGLLGSKFGAFGLMHGGSRFAQGYGGGFLSDNNTLGLALAMTVPLCWYCKAMAPTRRQSYFWTALTLFNISAVVMTYSRGAALATAAAFLMIASRSGKKMLTQLVLLGCLAAPAVYFVWDSYVDRIESISKTNDTGRGRLYYWRAALRMWTDYPLFGVGYGNDNYVALLPNYLGREDPHVVHNTYIQMLVDSGIGAFGLYLLLLGLTYRRMSRVAADGIETGNLDQANMAYAIQASLAAFAVGSIFLSRCSFDYLYLLIMLAAGLDMTAARAPTEDQVEISPQEVYGEPSGAVL
jgi:putative inorganic carbon (hco3(-)) transporter